MIVKDASRRPKKLPDGHAGCFGGYRRLSRVGAASLNLLKVRMI